MLIRGESGSLTVYTVGHGARSKEEFLHLLKLHDIKFLADVRRFPTSKTEHFKADSMKAWLAENSVEYVWIGILLGGYRKEGYDEYMKSEEFRKGIAELVEIAKKGNKCIMCLEISPKGCHRGFISKQLSKLRVGVIHIISEKRVEPAVG